MSSFLLGIKVNQLQKEINQVQQEIAALQAQTGGTVPLAGDLNLNNHDLLNVDEIQLNSATFAGRVLTLDNNNVLVYENNPVLTSNVNTNIDMNNNTIINASSIESTGYKIGENTITNDGSNNLLYNSNQVITENYLTTNNYFTNTAPTSLDMNNNNITGVVQLISQYVQGDDVKVLDQSESGNQYYSIQTVNGGLTTNDNGGDVRWYLNTNQNPSGNYNMNFDNFPVTNASTITFKNGQTLGITGPTGGYLTYGADTILTNNNIDDLYTPSNLTASQDIDLQNHNIKNANQIQFSSHTLEEVSGNLQYNGNDVITLQASNTLNDVTVNNLTFNGFSTLTASNADNLTYNSHVVLTNANYANYVVDSTYSGGNVISDINLLNNNLIMKDKIVSVDENDNLCVNDNKIITQSTTVSRTTFTADFSSITTPTSFYSDNINITNAQLTDILNNNYSINVKFSCQSTNGFYCKLLLSTNELTPQNYFSADGTMIEIDENAISHDVSGDYYFTYQFNKTTTLPNTINNLSNTPLVSNYTGDFFMNVVVSSNTPSTTISGFTSEITLQSPPAYGNTDIGTELVISGKTVNVDNDDNLNFNNNVLLDTNNLQSKLPPSLNLNGYEILTQGNMPQNYLYQYISNNSSNAPPLTVNKLIIAYPIDICLVDGYIIGYSNAGAYQVFMHSFNFGCFMQESALQITPLNTSLLNESQLISGASLAISEDQLPILNLTFENASCYYKIFYRYFNM